jgi:hypothetical protein
LNGHSHNRENVCLESLNKNGIQIFLIWPWEEWVLAPFSPRPPLFLFSAHKSHHLLPPLSSPALSHHRQASWPALHGAAKAAWPSGPASASEIFRGPTKSRTTPSGSLHAATFLCRVRYWRNGEPPPVPARQLHPQFCPWSRFPLRLEPRPPFPPLASIKAPPEAPKLVAPNLQLRRVTTCMWTHHSAPTLSKPTFPPPSLPQPKATELFPRHLPHQNNPSTTFSTSTWGYTAVPLAIFLTGPSAPPSAPAASSVPPSASRLGPPLPHLRPQIGTVCSSLASPTFTPHHRQP